MPTKSPYLYNDLFDDQILDEEIELFTKEIVENENFTNHCKWKKSVTIYKMPFSSIKSNDEWMKIARNKVATTYKEWPYCQSSNHTIDIHLNLEANNTFIHAFFLCDHCKQKQTLPLCKTDLIW